VTDTSRREALRLSLDELGQRVDAACVAAGRARDEVTVIAVTKTFPATDVRLLAGLGVRDVGENRDQEAAPKHAASADLGLRWHFVGRVQRNKSRSVAAYAHVVHSVDREEVGAALGAGARHWDRELVVLVQVSLDPQAPPGRGGVQPEAVPRLADSVAVTPGLRLGGVMGVAPLGLAPAPAFARLAAVAATLRAAHPAATMVSGGMSGDLDVAIHHGATHLRVGTALLGARPPMVG
jgi:hypothetical protein